MAAAPIDIVSPATAVPGRRRPPGRWIFAAALLLLVAGAALWPVLRLDPDWSVERFLGNWGAFRRDSELLLFVEGVEAAGLPVCVSDIVLAREQIPRRLPMCERKRHAG